MIIGHRYRYLFVELPHTASTAISRELRECYEGVPILRKHAYYHEFLRVANAEEKTYFVFSGIRNPLDEAVSLYLKYKTNHRGNYTNPRKLRKHGGHVTAADLARFDFIRSTNADFSAYFERFYRLPYDNWSSLAHHGFDYIIRFENLQDDFARVLQLLRTEQRRPLPAANPTAGREKDFWSHYTPEIYEQAKWVFGPFVNKWGYDFPPEWGDSVVSGSSQVMFHILAVYRNFRRKYLKTASSFYAQPPKRLQG
jgi:hypothetical protein